MGCEYGKPPVVVTVPVDDHPDLEVTDFSDTQIDTLRSTWPLLCSESSRVGVEVFVRIFREAPSVQALFQHYSIKQAEDLHHSQVFREHAHRFMGVLQNLVDHLETPQDVDRHLIILGAKHAAFEGYHPEYFRFYTKCMLDVWETELGEEFIAEVRDSWKRAFHYIVERMTDGFHMCISGQIQEVLDSSPSSPLPLPPSTPSATRPNGREESNGRAGMGGHREEGLVKVL